MKVAMVSEHASPLAVLGGVDAGGQNVHVESLSRGLAELGAQVVVHTRREDPAPPERVELAPAVTVHHVDAGPPRSIPKDRLLPHMDAFAAGLTRAWRAERPDVVHAHFWMSGRAALAAAAPLGIPVVQTFHALGVVKRRHQGGSDTSPPERQAAERAIVRRAEHIVATSTDEAFELRRLGADPHRVSIVPCGVDLALFQPGGPVAARTPGLHRLVVVSRLVERKGIDDVVTALASLPAAELVVAGGPPASEVGRDPEARRLLRLGEELGVADRVELRGQVSRRELPLLLRSADAVVCVPWYEPFGIVPLEAMACGVPVVVSAVGGLVDTVVDGLTGVHVLPRRPEVLARALADLLADEARRRRLGAAGARRSRERYGWPRVARATLECYRTLLASRRSVLEGVRA